MRLHSVISSYLLITNWHLHLTQRVYCLIPIVPYPVATTNCSLPQMITLYSAKRIAQIFISSRKVICRLFQKSHHNYITLIRELLPFSLSISPWLNLVFFHRLTILHNWACDLPQNLGYCYAILLKSIKDFLFSSTYRLTAKLRGKMEKWNSIFKLL